MKNLLQIIFIIFSFIHLNADAGNLKPDTPQQSSGEIKNLIPDLSTEDKANYKTDKPGWIEVKGSRTFSKSVSLDQAERELLQELRNDAINKKVSENIIITSLLTDVMSEYNGKASEKTAWSGFFRSTVSGLITKEKILFNDFDSNDNGFTVTIGLKAYVVPVKGQRDPGFNIELDLESDLLESGDELTFSVTPSKDCYVYVFNLMADQNVMLMFPNEYLKENYVQAKTTLHIPDPKISNYIKFRVSTMPDEQLTSESIYVVCTKNEVPVIKDLPKIGKTLKVFSENSQSFVKLERWLTTIPLDQRIEKNVMYHVSSN